MVLLISSALLAGCVQLAQPAPDLHSYRLDYAPPTSNSAPLAAVLRIAPFGVDAIYDREPIVFREDEYSTGVYHYHQWSSPPGTMIADLLARDLVASGAYRSIVVGPAVVIPDYHLDGFVEVIEERGKTHDCHAVLRLRVSLFRLHPADNSNATALQKTYDTQVPASCNEPHALAAAISQCVEQTSRQLQSDVYDVIAHDLATAKESKSSAPTPTRK
ncbi:MAG: membrane integrity-associated transporter subunit PqiC [Deltaproteobacteria bacterium]|nr:membrane integrity-associated transporter subunit PqiC [Deltaproteobacteria bacterium]